MARPADDLAQSVEVHRRRARAGWALSGLASVAWLGYVVAAGQGDRVLRHWESSITMLFGSFLSGSSPVGGGAVAFPVFTKVLDVPTPAARSFGLLIQAVGLSMAAIAVIVNRRPLRWRAAAAAATGSVIGVLGALVVLGDGSTAFRPMSVAPATTKAIFTVVFASTAALMLHRFRLPSPPDRSAALLPVHLAVLALAGVGGGVLSALTGTGANIVCFVVLVVLLDVSPSVALPTSIVVMAVTAVVGGFVLAGLDGQLSVLVIDDAVSAVGGVAPEPAGTSTAPDLFGLWLAAVPVVVWGAPLGSWFASHLAERALVTLVAALALLEVTTTVLLVEDIRTDPMLAGVVVLASLGAPAAVLWLRTTLVPSVPRDAQP